MSKSIRKIVIVGGGSAGWMSAATFAHRFPQKEVVVIESPNVPTVGVGESTLGFINEWLTMLNIKDEDFMKATDASYKLSIQFTDFYKKGSGSFHYPFGGVNIEGNTYGKNDWYMKKMLHPKTPVYDYACSISPIMALVSQNRISDICDLPNYNLRRDAAYHFDAIKFAIWLRDSFCKPRGVKHIQSEVKHVSLNEEGVEKLTLDTGEEIFSDLFVDCTGFKSLILGQSLKIPFISYEKILPNNSAWATQVRYDDKERELVPYTDCHAIENGWVWNTPLWSRIGTGYVFSDKYVDEEKALDEFKNHLEKKGKDTSKLNFKKLKFRCGIYDKIWVKNVLAIGLSAGFIEPLESNGLYSVHVFLKHFVRAIGRDEDQLVTQFDRDGFNWMCKKVFDSFAKFVSLHYALSVRNDTEYWKDAGKRTYASIDLHGDDVFTATFSSKYEYYNFADDAISCIATGLNYFPTDIHNMQSYNYNDSDLSEEFKEISKRLDSKIDSWNQIASKQPKLIDFLKERIYND